MSSAVELCIALHTETNNTLILHHPPPFDCTLRNIFHNESRLQKLVQTPFFGLNKSICLIPK